MEVDPGTLAQWIAVTAILAFAGGYALHAIWTVAKEEIVRKVSTSNEKNLWDIKEKAKEASKEAVKDAIDLYSIEIRQKAREAVREEIKDQMPIVTKGVR